MVYHVTINSKRFEVSADTTIDAIKLALDEFAGEATEDPDQCDINFDTQGINACGVLAGDLVEAPTP